MNKVQRLEAWCLAMSKQEEGPKSNAYNDCSIALSCASNTQQAIRGFKKHIRYQEDRLTQGKIQDCFVESYMLQVEAYKEVLKKLQRDVV